MIGTQKKKTLVRLVRKYISISMCSKEEFHAKHLELVSHSSPTGVQLLSKHTCITQNYLSCLIRIYGDSLTLGENYSDPILVKDISFHYSQCK